MILGRRGAERGKSSPQGKPAAGKYEGKRQSRPANGVQAPRQRSYADR